MFMEKVLEINQKLMGATIEHMRAARLTGPAFLLI